MNGPQVILRTEELHFAYRGGPEVLAGVSLPIREGELITLLGPNGAGKSTLLGCMMGFLRPQKGKILLAGRPIGDMSFREISRLTAYVAQNPRVTFGHTVREYAVMGRAPYLGLMQKPSKEDYALVEETLEEMGISHLMQKSYAQLSGGERQLVNVSRAIIQQPRLILLDEPTSALDYGNQIRVLRLIKRLSEQGYAILMTTHNPEHPLLLGGTVCILDREGKLRSGSPVEIMREDVLNEVYRSRLKIRRFEEDDRMICVSEKL